MENKLFSIFLLLLIPLSGKAQELIPLDQWRVHLSYNQVVDLDRVNSRIIAAAREGIFFYDISDGNITTLTSLDGIDPSEITSIGYDDEDNKLLFIGHSSGVIDIVSEKEVAQLTNLRDDYRNAKRVNEFYFRDSKAYIATEIGLLIYDMKKRVFIATYDGLGSTGEDIPVNDVVVHNNKIFAATDEGITAGPLTGANLNDFRQWERFEELPPAKGVALTVNGDKLFAALNGQDLYEREGSQWNATTYFPGQIFKALSADGNELLVTTENNIYSLIADDVTQLQIDQVQSPEDAFRGPGNTLWVADNGRGLINADEGEVIKASGPDNSISRLEVVNNILYGLPGRSGAQTDGFAAFEKGVWRNYGAQKVDDRFKIPLLENAYDVASFQDKLFISSGNGLLVMEGNNKVLWNAQTPSIPFQTFGGETDITGLAVTDAGLWIANYGASNALHLYNGQSFQSFNLSHSFILDIIVAPNGYLVMILDSNGLLVYDPATGNQRHLTNLEASGDLPSKNVNDVVFDHDGRMWVATTSGLAYFSSSFILFDPNIKAIVPVFNFRSLFRNRNVTSITIDGGGRKWFGTSEGAWLFNRDISEQIYYFNEENSPLLDDMVEDLILIQATGEVFFATPEGLVSFRTDASTPARALNNVRVFPNPVTPDFKGTVGITGIAADANVKITDVAGNLVFQTSANGSTASWHLLNNRGERITSGIYLIFTAKEDGTEALVGKIAVIR